MTAEEPKPGAPSAPVQPGADFARQASEPAPGFFAELRDFLRYNKKWWITPIVVVLVIIGVLILLGSTAAGPFIYTLF
jgi:hypothetical protein